MSRPIDALIAALVEINAPVIKTLVVHRRPDTDAWLCLWIAIKFLPKTADAQIVFVNSGQTLPGTEGNSSVLHFDTGGGEFDQHGKQLQRTCSAALLAQGIGTLDDPLQAEGVAPLIELATKVDNVEDIEPTSIHFLIEGYPRSIRGKDGKPDWEEIRRRVFEHFDILYGQWWESAKNRQAFKRGGTLKRLTNGLLIAPILRHPEWRNAAYESGAAVAIWTQSRGKDRFDVGIQVNTRRFPDLSLARVVADLRKAEAKKREVAIRNDAMQIGMLPELPGWFLHDSRRFVANGTRTHKPTPQEYTRLFPHEVVAIVENALSAIPRDTITKWGEAVQTR